MAAPLPDFRRRRGRGIGAYHEAREVATKLLMCSRVSDASWFTGDLSPELLLRRFSPVVHGLVALAHMETNKRVSEECKIKRTRKEGRGELGVDGNHRKRSFQPAEMADSGGKMRRPWGVLGAHGWGKRRRGSQGFYRTKEGRESKL